MAQTPMYFADNFTYQGKIYTRASFYDLAKNETTPQRDKKHLAQMCMVEFVVRNRSEVHELGALMGIQAKVKNNEYTGHMEKFVNTFNGESWMYSTVLGEFGSNVAEGQKKLLEKSKKPNNRWNLFVANFEYSMEHELKKGFTKQLDSHIHWFSKLIDYSIYRTFYEGINANKLDPDHLTYQQVNDLFKNDKVYRWVSQNFRIVGLKYGEKSDNHDPVDGTLLMNELVRMSKDKSLVDETAGILSYNSLASQIQMRTGGSVDIDEMEDALKKLSKKGALSIKELKNGMKVVNLVPIELSKDQNSLLCLVKEDGMITLEKVMSELGWAEERARQVFEHMVEGGMARSEGTYAGGTRFYFPGLFAKSF